MAKLCLVYGNYDPVKQFIAALGSLDYYYVCGHMDRECRLDLNREKLIIVPEDQNPTQIPEFVICFNDNYRSPMFSDVEWIVQGPEERLKPLERFNPTVIVRDGQVFIGNEVRQLMSKPFATLYVRPKSKATSAIIQAIMPNIDEIRERFEFNMIPVTDNNTDDIPSAVTATPALVTPATVVYTSEAIMKYLLEN